MESNEESLVDLLGYYTKQSKITEPGEYGFLFDDIPDDIQTIRTVVQEFMLHYQHARHEKHRISKERYDDIYLREVKKMLKRVMELDNRPLNQKRSFDKKLICNCRDFTVMLCSILRHKKIPCRVRYCFANYFDYDDAFYFDHTILECWDTSNKCWYLIEREESDYLKKQIFNINFDLQNVPRDMVIMSSKAWIMCRNGEISSDKFGNGYINRRSGLWYVRNFLLRDLASLNKKEMLIIDAWGLMVQPGTITKIEHGDQIVLLDKIARLLENEDKNLSELQNIYKKNTALQAFSLKYFSLSRGVVSEKYVLEE